MSEPTENKNVVLVAFVFNACAVAVGWLTFQLAPSARINLNFFDLVPPGPWVPLGVLMVTVALALVVGNDPTVAQTWLIGICRDAGVGLLVVSLTWLVFAGLTHDGRKTGEVKQWNRAPKSQEIDWSKVPLQPSTNATRIMPDHPVPPPDTLPGVDRFEDASESESVDTAEFASPLHTP